MGDLIMNSGVENADVLILNLSGFHGPELQAWRRAKEGESIKCEGPDERPAYMVMDDATAYGTHGHVGICYKCWVEWIYDPSPMADALRIFKKAEA